MKYIEKSLLPGEKIIYQTRLHWIIFLRPLISFGIGLLILVLGGPAVGWLLDALPPLPDQLVAHEDTVREYAGYTAILLGGLWSLLVLPRLLRIAVRVATSEFVVTDKRVVVKLGLIKRSTTELLLPKIESVQVEQSLLGRMLDYGTVVLTGTGTTHKPFIDIARPLDFRKHAQAQHFTNA